MAPPPAYNKYKDRKDLKTRDIKKSLVHKARLRKNYFKLLEKEGEVVPEKRSSQTQPSHAKEHQQQQHNLKLSYQDKIKINRERKLELKKLSLDKQREKLRQIEDAHRRRDLRKEKFSKKTKNGQPLMGPRISDLLSKIKENDV